MLHGLWVPNGILREHWRPEQGSSPAGAMSETCPYRKGTSSGACRASAALLWCAIPVLIPVRVQRYTSLAETALVCCVVPKYFTGEMMDVTGGA